MADFSAGHISTMESHDLLETLAKKIPDVFIREGVSYRNLLVISHGKGSVTTPPHDIVGQEIGPYLPKGGDADTLSAMHRGEYQGFQNPPGKRSPYIRGKNPGNTDMALERREKTRSAFVPG